MAADGAPHSETHVWEAIPYELRIGVTGHRDLANPQTVEAAVRELLEKIVGVLDGASADPLGPHGSPQSFGDRIDRALAHVLALGTGVVTRVVPQWPRVPVPPRRPADRHTTPLKLTVITSLARGADQLVARVVCAMITQIDRRERYVEAVLPFEVELYEQEFDGPDLDEFRRFLTLDCGKTNTHATPTTCRELLAIAAVQDQGYATARDEAFAEAGRRVVDTSEVIVAVWDPSHTEHPGGTAATVRYALNAGRLVLWLNPANPGAGFAVLRRLEPNAHPVVATRQSRPDTPAGCRVEPLPTRAKTISPNFHRLAAFNRDAAVDDTELDVELAREGNTLSKAAAASGLPAPVVATLLNTLLPLVVRADHLAVRYRELRQFAARLWPFMAAVVVSLMAMQIIFAPDLYRLAFLELAALGLGYMSYRVSVGDNWHGKWLNDRRLAESLRSAMYAALIHGVDDRRASSGEAPALEANPLPFYDPTNAWFIASVKRVIAKERRRFASSLPLNAPEVRRAIASFLKNAWILPQTEFHRQKAHSLERMARRSEVTRIAMIASLAVVAVLHGFGFGHGEHHAESPWTRIDLWIGFATVALPAWAAAFHVASSLDDHERLAERSRHMVSLLTGLARRLDDADTVEELVQRGEEAERIMDLESAEWAESLVNRRPEFTG
jgi:hypothetical protein